jgi:hypothetical protein
MLALEAGSAYVQTFLWFISNSVAVALPNSFFYGHRARSLFLTLLLDHCEPVHVVIITSTQRYVPA